MQLVAASNNKNKIKEIKQLLPSNINLMSLKDIGCIEDIPETSDTIKGNAIQKAQYVYDNYGYNCFADDTGLEVEVLNGEPGVFSARYAGQQRNANDNVDLLLSKLQKKENRRARFVTIITLIINGEITCFEGVVNGIITNKKSGKEGFGYDPIFQPNGYDCTFSEMSIIEKNQISHRGKAVKKLTQFINQNIEK